MKESFFKISVIDGAINLARWRKKYIDQTIDDLIIYLKSGPAMTASYDYEYARELCNLVGWNIFDVSGSRQEQLKEVLMRMALKLKPFWASISYLGRHKVRLVLNEDQLQCLQYAGLFDIEPSEKTIEWWELLSNAFRDADEDRKLKNGKKGEMLTIEFEKKRLRDLGVDRIPKWISFEDSTAGYDVLSFEKIGEDINEIKIEVKTHSIGSKKFYLSRNEWETAISNRETYKFHIWDLETETLLELLVEDVEKHIPEDNGNGVWQDTLINITK